MAGEKNHKGWIHTQTEGTPVRQLHQVIEPCQQCKQYKYKRNKKLMDFNISYAYT